MALKDLIIPPVYVNGQVVGRYCLQRHIDNDAVLLGIASRSIDPFDLERAIIASSGTPWVGCHRYRSDATILHWEAYVTTIASSTLTFNVKYDGHVVYTHVVPPDTTDHDVSGTYDLTGLGDLVDAKLYAVLILFSIDGDTGGSFTIYCPYTTYEGSAGALTYTAPHAIVDTDPSAITEWNTWRANDLYFQACLPSDPAQCWT